MSDPPSRARRGAIRRVLPWCARAVGHTSSMPPDEGGHEGGITQFALCVEFLDYVISRRAWALLGDDDATATTFLRHQGRRDKLRPSRPRDARGVATTLMPGCLVLQREGQLPRCA